VVVLSVRAKGLRDSTDVAVKSRGLFRGDGGRRRREAGARRPAAIVTDAGTVTALLLLDKLNRSCGRRGRISVTVQASVPVPVSELLLQETALSVAGACPVPLRLIAALPVEALLPIATDPLNAPAVAGSKRMVSVAVCFGFSVNRVR